MMCLLLFCFHRACLVSIDGGLEEIYSSSSLRSVFLLIIADGCCERSCVFALNNPQGCYCFARAEQIRDMSFGNE